METVATEEKPERTTKWLSKHGITICTRCKEERPSDDVVAVRLLYQTVRKSKTLKSRTIEKVCYSCLDQDETWNSDPRWE